MSDNSVVLSLPYIQAAQAQKHITHNEAIRVLDVLVQPVVADANRTAPPAFPTAGDRHIVAPGGTGDWAGQDGAIATWEGTAWRFTAPRPGWQTRDLAANATLIFDGAAWAADIPALPPSTPALGINASADSTNRLTVSAPAVLLNHEGAGHQLKINKSTPADTASLLFQTGFSGRAEMGLTGADDFAVKVSADGAAWHDALRVTAGSGAVTMPGGYGGTGSVAGILGDGILTFQGERNTVAVGNFVSYGNGAANIAGCVVPFDGRVIAATASVGGGSAGPVELTLAVDKVEIPSFTINAVYGGSGVSTAVADWRTAPHPVSAGEAVNFRITAVSGQSLIATAIYVLLD